MDFWAFESWGSVNLIAVLIVSLLVMNMIKELVPFLRNSLIPTSVLAGIVLLIIAVVYEKITGTPIFNTKFFNKAGTDTLEIITYHCLALGFIATSLRPSKSKIDKQRSGEIFNTGITTVSTYLMQAFLGLGITILFSFVIKELLPASGALLCFGYGQGTGQALNYGTVYEKTYGFYGGASFGLTIAAVGFLSASAGGIIHLNILKKKGLIKVDRGTNDLDIGQIQAEDEIPMNGSIDKLTIQLSFVFLAYIVTYLIMHFLGMLVGEGLKTTIFGFNFLFGVLVATLIKTVVSSLHNKNVIKKQYLNSFLLSRISGFFFDIMIVSGIAAIRIEVLKDYWYVLLILCAVGTLTTYFYNLFVAKKLFNGYANEQFLAMYGMLTGTASTGMILLREIDNNFTTPVAENLVYQNLPAIIFGFPMMLLGTLAPKRPYLTLIILACSFVVMNIILFRSFIFKKKEK